MSRIRVVGGVGDLAHKCRKIAVGARRDMRRKVNEGARAGNMLARDFARQSAGKHGRHYYKAFTWEARGVVEFGGVAGISAEYGPQIDRPQGGMSFERGSRNQPPHLDLARSADIIGPSFGQEVRQMAEGWFWGGPK